MATQIKEISEELKNTSVNYKTGYSEYVLTEEETDQALYECRKKKYLIQKENEYWAKVRKEQEPLKLTNEQLQKYAIATAKKQGVDFIKDEFNEKTFELLTLYFNNDAKFEEAGFSLKKGIMMFGGVGCGKTTLLKMFHANPKQSYAVAKCNDIAASFSKGGYEDINKYFAPLKLDTDIFGYRSKGIFFDDLGTEKSKKYFGNEANVMEEIILSWYDGFLQFPERLHLTTNLSVEDIESLYGTRVRSRMREMFNVFIFPENAPDRRK